jgi:hypothetical protein
MVEMGASFIVFLKLKNTEIDLTNIHFMVSGMGGVRWRRSNRLLIRLLEVWKNFRGMAFL